MPSLGLLVPGRVNAASVPSELKRFSSAGLSSNSCTSFSRTELIRTVLEPAPFGVAISLGPWSEAISPGRSRLPPTPARRHGLGERRALKGRSGLLNHRTENSSNAYRETHRESRNGRRIAFMWYLSHMAVGGIP